MTAQTLYSDAKAQEALTSIGDTRIAETKVAIVQQIIKARCALNGVSVSDALGGEELASDIVSVYKQLAVVTAA